jgi:hypothetical protein
VEVRGTSTPRKWRPLGLAFSVAAALALPACAFWELDDWDDHAGEHSDGGPDAGGDAKRDVEHDARAEGGPLTFCDRARADTEGRVLFCQDYDELDAGWMPTKCVSCTSVIEPGDGSPSPPNVLVLHSMAGESNSSVYQYQPFVQPFTSVSGEFWASVDEAQSDGEPALQQVAYVVNGENYVRFRITVFRGRFVGDLAITSHDATRYVEPHSLPADVGVWHHFSYNLSTVDGKRVYSWTVDGVPMATNEEIADASEIDGETTEVDLNTGLIYLKEPSAGDTGWRMDSVLLTKP